MRVVMMATGPFAQPTFRWLLQSQHTVVALVTRPSVPTRGRHKAPPSPLRQAAEQSGIPVHEPQYVNAQSSCELLAEMRPELLVVCDFGQILSSQTLTAASLGGINLHGSLLPKYRGAAPINWALLHGEQETGITVIHMTPKLDAGPCLSVRKTAIGPEETAIELEQRLAELGVDAVREAMVMLEKWDRQSEIGWRQDPEQATKAPRLKKSQGQVDWSRTAQQINNQVRALKPWPGTYTHWPRKQAEPLRLILEQVSIQHNDFQPAPPGTVVRARGKQLWIAAGQGAVALQQIQPAGKRVMDVEEFLRGYPLGEGDKMG